jgi:hypothetical protein
LKNIQNVILNTTNNTAASGFKTTDYADVKAVTVTTNGNGNDLVIATNGTNGSTINATHTSVAGGNMTVVGGTDVTATTAGGNLTIGNTAVATVPLSTQVATGAVVANQNNTGAGTVNVFGGTTVNVTTTSTSNTGNINVGNTAPNTGNTIAGAIANATGAITVATSGTGAVNVMGGSSVTITDNAAIVGGVAAGAGAITVGDANYRTATNNTTGNVTITETNTVAFNNLDGATNNNTASGKIAVYGGKDVSITTNAANNITVGQTTATKTNENNAKGAVTITNTGVSVNTATNGVAAAAQGAVTVTGGTTVNVTTTGGNVTIGRANNAAYDTTANPTGDVTVTETMNMAGFGRAIAIDGGASVTVAAKGQTVTIGASAASAPTGAVLVNQSDVFTGNTNAVLNGTNPGNVTVNGGTTVTVNTTGGTVTVGGVVAGVNTVASGAVAITNTFSGPGADAVSVQGGTTVGITTTKTSGAITVGNASAALTADGTALKDAALAPTGNVTIVDKTVAGGNTAYGSGNIVVNTNGATTVSVSGGDVDTITDIKSTLATGGANAGKAVGTSTLATVVIDGLQNNDGVAINSDALSALTLTKATTAGNLITVTNNTAAHALTITQGTNTKLTGGTTTNQVVDAKAGSITITDDGTASTATLRVDATKATAATINNAGAATIDLGRVSTDIATVTLKGAGATTLIDGGAAFGTGSLSKAKAVDASAATGDVTASLQMTATVDEVQSYKGGSAVDTITVNSNASGWSTKATIDGGNGSSDVLVANYDAAGTDVAMGNAANVKGFEILRLGTTANSGGNYDASGFSEIQTIKTGVAGNVAFTNVAANATLSVLGDTGAGARTITATGSNYTATNNAFTINAGTAGTSVADAGNQLTDAATGIITVNGIERLTVNAKGGYVDANDATKQDNFVEYTGIASNGATGLTIGGDRSLTLKTSAGTEFTSINASTNTGKTVDVTAAKTSNASTTFTGGSAALVAQGSADSALFGALVTIAGTGATPIANTETVTVSLFSADNATNLGTYTYTNGTGAAVSLATAATSIAAAINAGATTGSTVLSASAGNKNVGVTATASGGNIVLQGASVFSVNASTNAAAATVTDTSLGGAQQFVVTADAVGGAAGNGGTIGITFEGGTSFATAAIADGASAATVATAIATAITGAAAAKKPGVASAVVIDTNKVLVTMQSGQVGSMTLSSDGVTGGSGDAIVYAGGGITRADTYNMATVNNEFTTGSGGGTYTAGLGGSWDAVAHKFSSGSETVNLTASTAKTDTLKLADGAVVTDNGTKGGVTKFTLDSITASDAVNFITANKIILVNATTGVVNTVNSAATMASVLDSSGALNTKLANLTYTISNGVITFGATGGHSLSEFTTGELMSAAQILVSSSTTGGTNKVAAFSSGGRSFVVASDNINTLQAGTNNKSVLVELKDVASVKGFGTTGAEATIVTDASVVGLTGSAANNNGTAIDLAALATSSTLDYTGFSVATMNLAGTAAAK